MHVRVSCRDGLSPASSVDTVTSRRMDGNDESAGAGVALGYFRQM
jgi:hypothetical protein